METKKEILRICMKKGFLLDKEILDSLIGLEEEESKKFIEGLCNLDIKEKVITKSIFFSHLKEFRRTFTYLNKNFVEKFFVNLGYSIEQIGGKDALDVVPVRTEGLEEDSKGPKVKILFAPTVIPKKIVVQDFVKHFRARYDQIKKILLERKIDNLRSLRRIGNERETFSVIVSILNKRITKNKNIIFDVEDSTGSGKILVNNNRKELYNIAQELLVDDIVAFTVSGSSDILFANEVMFPDALLAEKKKISEDASVAVCSDLHIGSSMFLEDNFLKFIKWLNGEEGNEEQKIMAKKVKYLFVVGDTIDGVGVFPDQEKFLKIHDTFEQYEKLVGLLKLIRKDIVIIMCPGQHDAVWVGEPQLAIEERWAPGLYELENLVLVSNPCLVEISEGFKVLMYHGASMHGLVEEIQTLRLNFGHSSPTRITKEMLKRRHLAPMHGLCDYIPNDKRDPMVIDVVPDLVVTGDLHRSEASVYNKILLISSSCWQSITPFEEKVGNKPEPCKVPILNLKTREIKILDFSDEESYKTFETRKQSLLEKEKLQGNKNENRD